MPSATTSATQYCSGMSVRHFAAEATHPRRAEREVGEGEDAVEGKHEANHAGEVARGIFPSRGAADGERGAEFGVARYEPEVVHARLSMRTVWS